MRRCARYDALREGLPHLTAAFDALLKRAPLAQLSGALATESAPRGARPGFQGFPLREFAAGMRYSIWCRAACAQALSYWATALSFVAGLPGFPAYLFVALENGEPVPLFDLAPAPMEKKLVAPQLERTFEPVCPCAADAARGFWLLLGTKGWRLSAKAAPVESVSTQEAMAMETL